MEPQQQNRRQSLLKRRKTLAYRYYVSSALFCVSSYGLVATTFVFVVENHKMSFSQILSLIFLMIVCTYVRETFLYYKDKASMEMIAIRLAWAAEGNMNRGLPQ